MNEFSIQEQNLAPIYKKLKLIEKDHLKKVLVSKQDLDISEMSIIENSKLNVLNGYSKIQELKLVKIGLASSEQIIQWAEKLLPNGKVFGEVLNANTLHYKTFKPHKGGLFCERIFGPLKDFECACGIKQKPFDDDNYVENLLDTKKIKRLFCSQCDVEYTWSVLRRYQLGYIQLAAPVTHLWYLKTNPSYLSLLLDMQKRDLESIVYCMQITTLEYSWKPLYALQVNLDASALFRSYKNFLKLETYNKSNYRFSKQTRDLIKKQESEIQKRKKMNIKREHLYLTSTSLEKIESLKKEPLQKQIQYLEKSFQLSTTDFSRSSFFQMANITSFLQQKVSRKVKKKTFFTIYQIFMKNCYTKIFQVFTNRSVKNMPKFQIVSRTETNKAEKLKTKSENFQPFKFEREKRNFSKFGLLLKKQLQSNEKKKIASKIDFHSLLERMEFFIFSSFRNSLILSSTNLNNQLDFLNPLEQKKDFLYALIRFLTKTSVKKSWVFISIKTLRRTSLFWFGQQNEFSKILFSNVKYFIENSFFLYLLMMLQAKNDLFFTLSPLSRYLKEIIFQLRYFDLRPKVVSKKQKRQDFEFVLKFLQTNNVNNKLAKTIEFFEIKSFFSEIKELFFPFLNTFLQKFVWFNLHNQSFQKTFVKKIHVFLEIRDLEANKFSKSLVTNSFGFKNLKNISKVFNERNLGRKSYKFLKNEDIYLKTAFSNSKNTIRQLEVLKKEREKYNLPHVELVNNIYTVAYSKSWFSEKDWKYFLYYSTSTIEMTDTRSLYYNYRFSESDRLKNPVIGAHFLEKILNQYQGLELKIMAKQTQMVLPKLNRYIRFKKQKAIKKIEFVEIQKLLQKRDEMIRRLKLLRKLFKRNSKTTSMILNTLPVLPPDLRPILKMQNQIAASDLNRFYQRILYRNDRLKKFLRSNGTWVQNETGFEIKYAHRLLQEAVDNLIQNGKGSVKPETNSRGQPLKSLSEILKGKQGRFRQYLLGKRVDYSGRSVIVVGPKLKIYECGLPFEMAIELFLPFLIKKIFQYKLAKTIVGAKTILKTQFQTTWTLLEEVIQNHPILLNRAPTLHRLGIQSFQPKLIEGRAILLHPLVCPAFNADFDGDQMAVHVPITVEARTEAWKLMFSRNHLISPATGEPMLLPSQDMVLGCYFLTTEYFQRPRFNEKRPFVSTTQFYFANMYEVLQAYSSDIIHLQTPIWIKWNGLLQTEDFLSKPLEIRLTRNGFWTELRSKSQKRFNPDGKFQSFFIRTTAGRVLFNNLIQNCIQNA